MIQPLAVRINAYCIYFDRCCFISCAADRRHLLLGIRHVEVTQAAAQTTKAFNASTAPPVQLLRQSLCRRILTPDSDRCGRLIVGTAGAQCNIFHV